MTTPDGQRDAVIRLATIQDIPVCVKASKTMGPMSCAPGHETVTIEMGARWMTGVLSTRTNYRLYVAERDGLIKAGCGGALENFNYPPHQLFVYEWAWWREPDEPKRTAAQLWNTVCRWGQLNGAVLAGYVIAKAGRSSKVFTEVWKYKELISWETSHPARGVSSNSPTQDCLRLTEPNSALLPRSSRPI